MNIEIKTKFNIGDLCCGFVDKDIHTLKIDRIDICSKKVERDKDFNNIKIIYYATVVDSPSNTQHTFEQNQLFTDEEVASHINEYFKTRSIIIKRTIIKI